MVSVGVARRTSLRCRRLGELGRRSTGRPRRGPRSTPPAPVSPSAPRSSGIPATSQVSPNKRDGKESEKFTHRLLEYGDERLQDLSHVKLDVGHPARKS